jgi:serine/threonine protein kinase
VQQEPANDPLLGHLLDESYRIDSWLTDGGMATIYRGTQVLLDRPVAIKVMRSELRQDPEARLRFKRELKLSRTISHPNVVSVYDGGVFETGETYLVMEYLVGHTLDQEVSEIGEAGLATEYALELFVQLCDAVEAIHESGLLHRDLKPSNVFLVKGRPTRRTSGVRVKVLDFGLVRQADDRAATSLTKERATLGTAGYLAPEQIQSKAPPDQRADIYALGGLLAFMLTGHNPFASPSLQAAIQASMQATIGRQLFGGPSEHVLERLPAVPGMRALVERALAREPGQRFPSVAALREAILELALPDPDHELAARLATARPGKPRESEFHTDAVPLDGLVEPETTIDDYPAPMRLISRSVLDVLRSAGGPLSTAEIRDRLRHETTLDIDAYVRVLEALADDLLVIAGAGSWRIRPNGA